ncbi:light-harvesting protein [Hymenobacter lutimineralis]|uniref:Light-harvesting protein n=1 Tax=Hymenobacter lutimineralis TaxID=2606448 RepID=A0A5D6USU3_9BACT|nr:light-harvesting protein [Hymenobacter lutimineralis]TYZ06563.1 light-harvesting protein [Hymenobacter lutimineralis]
MLAFCRYLTVPASTSAPAAVPPVRPRVRWGWWLVAGLGLVAGLALAVHFLLDPWLRRQAETQVARRTHGRYQLRLRELHTSLWRRTLTVRGIDLVPTPALLATDSLALRLHASSLRVAGIGLGALLRRQVVPIDSLVLQAPHLRLTGRRLPAANPKPLHQRLPRQLPGLRLGYLSIQEGQAAYRPTTADSISFRRGTLVGQDILLAAAGVADTQRVVYAAAWQLRVADGQAKGYGYRLQLGALGFATKSGLLRIDSLRVRPLVPISNRRSELVRVALSLPVVRLTGLQVRSLRQGRFTADTLRLQGPDLSFTPARQPPPPLHELVAGVFPRFRLGSFLVVDGRVRAAGLSMAPRAEQVMVQAQDLRLEKAASQAPGRIFYGRSWGVRTGPGSMLLDAPYYRLAYQRLDFSTTGKTLRLSNSGVQPTMSLEALSRRKGHQMSHIRLWAPQLQATGIDWAALTQRGYLKVDELALPRPVLRVAGDGRYPINPRLSVVTPEALRRLPFQFELGRLRIQRGDIWFRYRSARSPQLGRVSITQLSGTLTNLSNNPRRVRLAPVAVARATALFQQRSRVGVTIRLPLLRADGRHTATGTFSRAPFSILNPITVPGRSARFKSGDVDQVRFAFTADRQGVRGQMWAAYSNLKLELLTEHKDRGVKKLLVKAKSKLVDGLLIRNNNPRKPGQELKTGVIESSRDRRLSVFAIWQQALISGMLHSMGVPRGIAKKTSEASSAPKTMPPPGSLR